MGIFVRNMMTKITTDSSDKFQIEVNDIGPKDLVDNLRGYVSRILDVPTPKIKLLFGGRPLYDASDLEEYGVKNGSVVFAFEAAAVLENQESGSIRDIESLSASIQELEMSPAFRHKVKGFLLEVCENLMQTIPSLNTALNAESVLLEPLLIHFLAQQDNLQEVKDAHPELFALAAHMATAVNMQLTSEQNRINETAAANAQQRRSLGSYSMDMMSDDEDEDAAAAGQQSGSSRGARQGRRRHQQRGGAAAARPQYPRQGTITADFLQRALAAAAYSGAAGGSASPSAATAGPSTAGGGVGRAGGAVGAGGSGPGQGTITQDMFTSALQSAMNPSPAVNLDAQIQQMRAVGITNDEISRRALMATGGDVNAALEWIFGGSATGENPPQQ